MSIFKKASVTPIVKTVISQGLENPEGHMLPVNEDKGYMKMISGQKLNHVLSEIKKLRDHYAFQEGDKGDAYQHALDIILENIEDRTY
jgi:hypothetical protein